MDITFPIKGWDTNHPRNTQPDQTSPDLLNVVPFDRDYRGRGSIRPGVSKFAATQMGSGAPLTMLTQVTTALDPNTVSPGTLLIDEPFVYADATTVGSIGAPNWRVSHGASNRAFNTGATVSASCMAVFGNAAAGVNPTGGGELAAALYSPVVVLGVAYIIKADMYITGTFGSGIAANGLLYARADKVAFSDTGMFFKVGTDQCLWDDGTTSASFSFGTALTVGFHTCEIRVSGDTFTFWVDGVKYLTRTTTAASTQVGFGFGIGKLTTGRGVKNFKVYAGTPLAVARQTSVVAVSNGNVYQGDSTGMVLTSGGSAVLSATLQTRCASSKGVVYMVDSQHKCKVLDLTTQTVSDIAPTAGAETATTLGAYSLACVWRDRLVLAASLTTPQNFIMSRQGITSGTNVDFDYSQTDAAAAVAGNASKAGAIGDPLNCLIPWTDDILLLGGDHSIYKVEGDIAAGGQILLVSDSVGTLGADSWDSDPSGNVYFVGSGGLYQMTPSGPPVNLANDVVKNIFASINRATTYVCLTWDRDRNGLHVHLTPVNTGTTTHIFYDATTQGFFPIQYPNTVGPLTSIVFDGDGPLDRQVLLAGRDGYIRKVDPAVLTDDGTAITSYVKIGPFRPAGLAALSVLEAVEVLLGDAPTGFTESDFQVGLSVVTGKDAYTALTNPERTVTFAFTKQSRRKRLLQRISGGTFYFKFTGVSGKLWSLEKLVALFTEGGLQRRY